MEKGPLNTDTFPVPGLLENPERGKKQKLVTIG